jgi:Zn-finger nucleic acid-binding protein
VEGAPAGSAASTCTCPAPPAPGSATGSSPYRTAAPAPRCPRCNGSLGEAPLGDVMALGCGACGGVFLDRATTQLLGDPTSDGRHRRLAFPRGEAPPPEAEVRYLMCPTCQQRMNRQAFLGGSGVVVDVCKDHGVWFDRGELGAVVTFVESGGLERLRRRRALAEAERARELRGKARVRELEERYRGPDSRGSRESGFFLADAFGDLF